MGVDHYMHDNGHKMDNASVTQYNCICMECLWCRVSRRCSMLVRCALQCKHDSTLNKSEALNKIAITVRYAR